jgi:hypothetical protein
MLVVGEEDNFGDMRAGWMYDKWLGFPSLEVI